MVGRRHRIGAKSGGFTLLELITAIAVLAVLITLAAPSLHDMIIGTRVRTAASDLLQAVILARSEAIKRAANVSVVPGASGFGDGWTIVTGTTTLETHEAPSSVSIDANTSGSITYRLDGRVSTNVRLVTVYTTESGLNVKARCIVIDASGRATIRTDTDNDHTNGC